MVDHKISQLYVGNSVGRGRGRGPHYKIRSVPDLNYKDLIGPTVLCKPIVSKVATQWLASFCDENGCVNSFPLPSLLQFWLFVYFFTSDKSHSTYFTSWLLKITKHNSRTQIICMLLLVFQVKGANNIFIFQVALVSRRIWINQVYQIYWASTEPVLSA